MINDGASATYRPTSEEIEALLRRAETHPFGLDFIADGALDAVAATFQVHAFVVEAARLELRRRSPAGVAR